MARTASRTQLEDQEVLARNRALFTSPEPYPDFPTSKTKANNEQGTQEEVPGGVGGSQEGEDGRSQGFEGEMGTAEGSGLGQPGTRGRDKRRPPTRVTSAKSPTAGQANGGASNNCRYDSSLGLLTKKFVALVEGAQDGVLDLNKAAESLQVQKRRIYDITNVLEGIGLIEKKSKNNIQWKGTAPTGTDELQAEYKALQNEVFSLNEDSSLLEKHIKALQEAVRVMTEHPVNKGRMYVTNDDIIRLQSIGRDTVFAVTAPHGTTLVVPDPDEGIEHNGLRRYRAVLTSRSDPIDVWLVTATHHSPGGSSPGRELSELPQAARSDHASTAVAGQQLPAPAAVMDLKLEDQNFGIPGPIQNGLLPSALRQVATATPVSAHEVASPTFMKLQTPDMDPESWFENGAPPLGVGDIFGDTAM